MASNTEPQVKKIDITIARLRLLLADLTSREAALEIQSRTFADQHEKLITFALYGDTNLDHVLTMMAEVEQRLAHVDTTGRALAAIRRRAEAKLESLQLTKGVEEAKVLLQQLQARQLAPAAEDGDALSPEEIQAEIQRLRLLIADSSERAARALARSTRAR